MGAEVNANRSWRRRAGVGSARKVRSSGRFGKTHQQRCTSMYTDQ